MLHKLKKVDSDLAQNYREKIGSPFIDIFDALTTDRSYRNGMSKEKAIEVLLQEAEMGKLDKDIVGQLVDYLNKIQ